MATPELGFGHNNCGSLCIRGGHRRWAHVLEVFPERYAEAERQEQQLRAELGDVAILRADADRILRTPASLAECLGGMRPGLGASAKQTRAEKPEIELDHDGRGMAFAWAS